MDNLKINLLSMSAPLLTLKVLSFGTLQRVHFLVCMCEFAVCCCFSAGEGAAWAFLFCLQFVLSRLKFLARHGYKVVLKFIL